MGRNVGLPIDLAHCLYDSLLLSHKSWYEAKISSFSYEINTQNTAEN